MGAREITYWLIKLGISPGIISQVRKVSLATTLVHLDQMIGQGRLRRSDVFFSISKEVREKYAGAVVRPDGVSCNDFQVLQRYGDAAYAMGDMYEDLRCVEVSLHGVVWDTLVESFGETESGWWRQGVPMETRRACQDRRECDIEPAKSAYCYTDLLDLARIVEANWSLFSPKLPARYASNRKSLLKDLRRLNSIRRTVMHPVRGNAPTEDDFDFTRRLKKDLVPDTMNPAEEEQIEEIKTKIAAALSRSSKHVE